jgi:NADH-quinone oxidoreductase subunit F/NADP-reducing hydrogenase subunit HndC
MQKLTIDELKKLREQAGNKIPLQNKDSRGNIVVHMGTCGMAAGAKLVESTFLKELANKGIKDITLMTSGCAGFCSKEPMVTVELADSPPVRYGDLNPEKVEKIVSEHLIEGNIVKKYAIGIGTEKDIPFFKKQEFIVLRNKGMIDPGKIEDYLARNGYAALERVLTSMKPAEVIEEIIQSGLRGRGGAGFPTGIKWKICSEEKKTPKYIIGNCDEGDPGAYMDRNLVEADPHSLVEGMTIAAYAIGAAKGYMYIRTEYPLAVEQMKTAISQAKDYGLLGENILGSGFDFDMEIREGAGAFVCGEETSLIHSIEGNTPEPAQRPPFPAQAGIWGCPTVINNVETLANVPVIIDKSAQWYSKRGTQTSKGTKIFSLVGKINNSGLIEVPMGITLKEVIYDIGGGIPGKKKFKAVQTGGPSGGCIPMDYLDLPIDYESLKETGSIMGSGGMIVMDEDTCMVDVSKFFIQFTNEESCGKCNTCREGSKALLQVLTRITSGEGREGDIEYLEELCLAIGDGSMCGLGKTLPNPVLSTIKYFRDEYEAHIKDKKCPALVCRKLIEYRIIEKKCTGCQLCVSACPVGAITGPRSQPHNLDSSKCTKCRACYEICRFDAIAGDAIVIQSGAEV